MKIYLSDNIKSYTQSEIIQGTKQAKEMLGVPEDEAVVIIENDKIHFNGENIPNLPVFNLGFGISKMGKADAIIFLESYEADRASRIEHSIAEEYGIPLVIVNERGDGDQETEEGDGESTPQDDETQEPDPAPQP